MGEIINLLISGLFVCGLTFWMVFTTCELALLVLLHWQGKRISAELDSVKKGRIRFAQSYTCTYLYDVSGETYRYFEVHQVNLFLRGRRWEPEKIDLLYLPRCPAVARAYGKLFAFARIGIAIIMVASGFFCAFMLYMMTHTEWMFGLWLLLMGIFLLFPKLAIHPLIEKLFWVDYPGGRKSKNGG